MKILVVSQYFWPESFIINDIARLLAAKGAEVSVFTGKPNYPDGEVFEGYQVKGLQRDSWHGVDILRVPLIPRKKAKLKDLLCNYFSFMANGLRYSRHVVDKEPAQLIFCFMLSPITSVVPAIWLKWRTGAPLVLWVQDLWPESVSATGFIRNRFILFMIRRLVKWVYTKADLILVQSRAFIKPISVFTEQNKIAYFPNSFLATQKASNNLMPWHKFPAKTKDSFHIVFAGNFGQAQGLETILDAAERVKEHENIQIVMVGSGHKSDWLDKQKKQRGLENVYLVGRLPMDAMSVVFDWADALLVTLRNELIFNYTIPSKVQAYMSAGKPIIAALNGEGRTIIEESGAGSCCEAGNAQQLSRLMLSMSRLSNEERGQMGVSARAYFDEYFDMNKSVDTLYELLKART